jgi:hypothetical protein
MSLQFFMYKIPLQSWILKRVQWWTHNSRQLINHSHTFSTLSISAFVKIPKINNWRLPEPALYQYHEKEIIYLIPDNTKIDASNVILFDAMRILLFSTHLSPSVFVNVSKEIHIIFIRAFVTFIIFVLAFRLAF